jgi:DNA-binding MarR family transcriptional regulator
MAMVNTRSWRMFCSHGVALFYVALHPGCTVDDIAVALVVAPKTAWRLARELRRAGLIKVRREGRRDRYWPESEGRLPDPVLSHVTLRQIMNAVSA